MFLMCVCVCVFVCVCLCVCVCVCVCVMHYVGIVSFCMLARQKMAMKACSLYRVAFRRKSYVTRSYMVYMLWTSLHVCNLSSAYFCKCPWTLIKFLLSGSILFHSHLSFQVHHSNYLYSSLVLLFWRPPFSIFVTGFVVTHTNYTHAYIHARTRAYICTIEPSQALSLSDSCV